MFFLVVKHCNRNRAPWHFYSIYTIIRTLCDDTCELLFELLFEPLFEPDPDPDDLLLPEPERLPDLLPEECLLLPFEELSVDAVSSAVLSSSDAAAVSSA